MIKKIIRIYKKVNGKEVIRDYFRNHVFLYACIQSLLLLFSRKGLEIVRLGIEQKKLRKLKKKYKKYVDKWSCSEIERKHNKTIWICWFQGLEQAPELVRKCIDSIQFPGFEKIILTDDNIFDYVDLPSHIIEKYNCGKITRTHFSDILRVELLSRYGGTWVDATVFCSNQNLPSYMLEDDLFMFQTLKPGKDGHSVNTSSWFITACAGNPIVVLVRDLLREYWKTNNRMTDYFLLHYFFEIAIEKFSDEWDKVVPYSNEMPHIFLLNLFKKYDEKWLNSIFETNYIHKMSYKFEEEQKEMNGTYYKYFMERM